MKVAFIGKMMSGKTTSANYLVRNYGFTRLAFADPVKVAAAKLLNLLEIEIGPEGSWESEDAFWDYDRIQREKGNPAVRKLLQLVGTELGRELIGYEDVWVDLLLSQVDNHEHVVVDDCRFPNEAEALRDAGFSLIRVTRPENDRIALVKARYPTTFKDILSHPSETSLDGFDADNTFDARNLQELEAQIRDQMEYYNAH